MAGLDVETLLLTRRRANGGPGNGSMSVVCQSREPKEGRKGRGPVLMGISGLWWGTGRVGFSLSLLLACLLFTAGTGAAMAAAMVE